MALPPPGSVLGDAVDLGQAGQAVADFQQGRLAQVAYPGALGGFGNLDGIAALQHNACLFYTYSAAEDKTCVDLGGRRITYTLTE